MINFSNGLIAGIGAITLIWSDVEFLKSQGREEEVQEMMDKITDVENIYSNLIHKRFNIMEDLNENSRSDEDSKKV